MIFYISKKSVMFISLKCEAFTDHEAETDIYKIIQLRMRTENIEVIKDVLTVKLFCKKLF